MLIADLPDGATITVNCRICGHTTNICVEGLKKHSPGTTVDRVKQRARCETCGSNEVKRPGMVVMSVE